MSQIIPSQQPVNPISEIRIPSGAPGETSPNLAMLLSFIMPVIERNPKVMETLCNIQQSVNERILPAELAGKTVSEGAILWDALRFIQRRWNSVILPSQILNDSRLLRNSTGIFNVVNYESRLNSHETYLRQQTELPNERETVHVRDVAMIRLFGARARILQSRGTVVKCDTLFHIVVEFTLPDESSGRSRRARTTVNYNEDSDDENTIAKASTSTNPAVLAHRSLLKEKKERYTVSRSEIIREDDVNVIREPVVPSQHDLIRVMRLISYILYAASVNSIISAACQTIGEREIEEWAEEAFGTTDDHYEKWDGMREEADRFESLLCEWNITMICGPTLLQEWNDIEFICFDY